MPWISCFTNLLAAPSSMFLPQQHHQMIQRSK